MLRKTFRQLSLNNPYLLVVAVALALFFPTWLRLITEWLEFQQVLAHGLITALIFMGLLLIHPPSRPAPNRTTATAKVIPGAIALLIVTLLWLVVELTRIDTLTYLLLPAGLLAICWTLLGFTSALVFLPYVLLFSLALPIWADLVPLLVEVASRVVGSWVQLFDMTALIEGNSITLAYGRLIIADGCSGIRYFAISILLAMMIAILNDYRWKGWLLAVSAGALLALLANWFRIFILVVIGYETRMQSPVLTDHELLGWVVFGVFILPALYFAPNRKRITPAPTHASVSRAGVAFIGLAFLIGPIPLYSLQPIHQVSPPWRITDHDLKTVHPSSLPIQLNVPSYLEHTVFEEPDTYWVSLAQSEKSAATGHKLVPYLPPIINREIWLIASGPDGIELYTHLTERRTIAAYQWFQVGNYKADSYRRAKLLQIPATFSGESRFALVTLMAECAPLSCNEAIQSIKHQRQSLRLEPTR